MDFARARDLMVESQVRTNDVTEPRVLHAMRTLPRERFAPPQKRTLAYGDLELEVAPGRVLMRPRDLSKLIVALNPQPNERALEIAGATGYGAAVLAACRTVIQASMAAPLPARLRGGGAGRKPVRGYRPRTAGGGPKTNGGGLAATMLAAPIMSSSASTGRVPARITSAGSSPAASCSSSTHSTRRFSSAEASPPWAR